VGWWWLCITNSLTNSPLFLRRLSTSAKATCSLGLTTIFRTSSAVYSMRNIRALSISSFERFVALGRPATSLSWATGFWTRSPHFRPRHSEAGKPKRSTKPWLA